MEQDFINKKSSR